MTKTLSVNAAALPALAEPRRREILRLVWSREKAAGEIAAAMPITFGAVSQHLRVLREAGAVKVRQDGRQRFYRADRRALGPMAKVLEAFWAQGLDRLKDLAEEEEANHGTRRR